MVPALADKQQLAAIYNNSPPRARQPSVGLMGSIWAPQPQLSDTTWPKALDSFSLISGKEGSHAASSDVRNVSLQQPAVTGEEVFGLTPQGTLRAPIRDVGAIGDGRKKNTPDHGDSVCYICLLNLSVKLTFIQHVEQLLRTLNLNSPAPFNKPSIFALNIETSPSSPDFSPASVSPALLTPTDLSPARPFDIKLHSPYDHVPSGHPYLSQSSLLMENHSPVKNQDALISNPVVPRSPLVQLNHPRQQAPSNNFPFFEAFHEPLSSRAASGIQLNSVSSHPNVALYNTPVASRRMDARVSGMDWRMNSLMQHHQIHQSSNQDWHLASEKSIPDYLPSAIGGGHAQEEPLRASFVYQQPPAAQSVHTPHEVRSCLHITIPMCSYMRLL